MQQSKKIAIIGGGVAGSTVALKLSDLGLEVSLFERNQSLVSGPPVCHLHAGGSLYRELSDEHCKKLLVQSIETFRAYQHCVKIRPTVIAVPKRDQGEPLALLPRLHLLQAYYQELITADPANEVLGKAQDYFQLFEKEQIEKLAQCPLPVSPQTPEEWMIPLAKELDLERLKFPLVLVQEYGVSLFRVAASVQLSLAGQNKIKVYTNSEVTNIKPSDGLWSLEYTNNHGEKAKQDFDYLINASGFRSGTLDDLVGVPEDRMVEFKAAYITQWTDCPGVWPEVVFHGERGTENGMAQLTPYANNVFQLHGMSKDITLFKNGLVASNKNSAQPLLPKTLLSKINQGWPEDTIQQRTQAAINHLAYFIPNYASAQLAGKPLFGAQQIPGDDPNLRTGSASFPIKSYARSEIVKLSSAISAANDIVEDLKALGFNNSFDNNHSDKAPSPLKATEKLKRHEVLELAEKIAVERGYPAALAL